MPHIPTDVEVNEDNILKLTKVYKEAYKSILEEIMGATDFGKRNRRAILAQIENILEELGADVQDFLEKELPEYYKSGADDAIEQLEYVGGDINVKRGFNRIHQQAIIALIDETALSFGDTLTGVGRSARRILDKATKEMITQKLAEGEIGGKATRDIRLMVKGVLQEEGLDALVDKAGRRWTLDRYSEMLLRTKAVEARNRGLINRIVENGHDLVQVSSHPTSCPLCAPWQGKILSITGVDDRYPSLATAEKAGLFHPNCKHAINVIDIELAKKTKAYNATTKKYE